MRARAAGALTIAALAASVLALAGCGTNTTVQQRLVPRDVEAADLKRAYDQGLLTRAEYQQQLAKMGLPQP